MNGTLRGELPEIDLEEEQWDAEKEEKDEIRDEKNTYREREHVARESTTRSKHLTSSVSVAQIGKAPNGAKTNGIAQAREEEIEPA